MNTKQLGHSQIHVSMIGFGCMSLQHDQKENEQLISAAIHEGINFFDTADVYANGRNEESLGKALKSSRKQVVIASKVGNVFQGEGKPFKWDASASHILQSIDLSLRRLQTDYIDLYQLHGGTLEDNLQEVIAVFEELKKAGKIRAYGISSIRPNVIRRYLDHSSIDSVMMQYSLLDRRPEEESLDAIHNKGISVLARGGLAQGLLAGKHAKDYLGHTPQQIDEFNRQLQRLGDPVTLALQYILQNPAITSVIAGIRTMRHLNDAIIAAKAPSLDPDTLQAIKMAIPAFKYKEHR